MLINFLNESYLTRSPDQNNSNLVNMYLDIENKSVTDAYNRGGLSPEHGKYKIIAYPSSGKTLWSSNVTGNSVRGSINHLSVYYAVIDNTFYSFNSSGVATNRGTLSTSSGACELAFIKNEILISDGTHAYLYVIDTTTFTDVTANLPFSGTIQTITAQDEYFFMSQQTTNVVWASAISDGSTWNALSFGLKNTYGDSVVKLLAVNSRLWVIGSKTTEIWYNTGATPFAYSIVSGGVYSYGCAVKSSVTTHEGVIYMIGASASGGLSLLSVSETGGVMPASNQGILNQFNKLSATSDCVSYCYEKLGHVFCMFTFPTAQASYEYDITVGMWSQRKSYISGNYVNDIGSCHSYAYGYNLIGDLNSGNIYYLDDTNYQENGNQIIRQLVTPPAYNSGNKLFVNKLQVDLQNNIGSDLSVTLEASFDSGQTFTDTYTGNIPSAGGRLYWTRLGMTQNAFVFRLTFTGNGKFIILGAQAEIEQGIN